MYSSNTAQVHHHDNFSWDIISCDTVLKYSNDQFISDQSIAQLQIYKDQIARLQYSKQLQEQTAPTPQLAYAICDLHICALKP